MRIKNTQPKPYPFLTTKRKAEEELHTHPYGDVVSLPELKKQNIDGNAGEEVDDLESGADELEDLITGSTEVDESSQPIDISQQELLDGIDELEAKDRELNKKINLIKGPKSTDQSPDSPLDITEEFWKYSLVACFDEGETMITDPIWPWQAYEYQINQCPDFPNATGTIFTDISIDTGNYYSTENSTSEEHLGAAAGTFGCTSTPLPCESKKGQTDPIGFEAMYTSNLRDQQFMVDFTSTDEPMLIDSLWPGQYELRKNNELIIID